MKLQRTIRARTYCAALSGVLVSSACVLCCLCCCIASDGSRGTAEANGAQTNSNSAQSDDENPAGPGNDNTPDDNASPAGPGDPLAGAALYGDVNNACAVCHGPDGEGTVLGPSIRDVAALELETALAPASNHTGGDDPGFTPQDRADLAAFLSAPPADADTNGPAPEDIGSSGLITSRRALIRTPHANCGAHRAALSRRALVGSVCSRYNYRTVSGPSARG